MASSLVKDLIEAGIHFGQRRSNGIGKPAFCHDEMRILKLNLYFDKKIFFNKKESQLSGNGFKKGDIVSF